MSHHPNRRIKFLAAVISLSCAGQVFAVGTGTIANGGTGTITTNGVNTSINQTSDKLILNWNNFNIAKGESVNITQPDANSAILNRVNSNDITNIQGKLSANGRVFVVNPNGIMVGAGAQINAGGVVLSTLNISDMAFNNATSSYIFSDNIGSNNATVENNGTINADGYGAFLFAPHIVNGSSGAITTKNGSIGLVAGTDQELAQTQGAVPYVRSFNPVEHASINNAGSLTTTMPTLVGTPGYYFAHVNLQAAGLVDSVINHTGIISATNFVNISNNTSDTNISGIVKQRLK
ncbi:filamentous hemagglutinin N-terminal domain-containing protein [Collimonas pratensis]|uniref:Filamentous hemagglutinin family N-terminal domain protein n=1 Tax=Collimonas pratensis TaxID=279113 RepID=A0ABM5Z7I4_9BURK|nr:filamentous hemagglutinin N-terminal domain-containing protein [Collimonas pratensis]AMP15082.1 filamentous hemagglutinin family N-terminal domain protein [Collimonas pratensis]